MDSIWVFFKRHQGFSFVPCKYRGEACQGRRTTLKRGLKAMTTKPVPIRVLACALLAVGFKASLPRPGQSEEAPASRDQQIADLQKQIGDLQKKLADLKKDNG